MKAGWRESAALKHVISFSGPVILCLVVGIVLDQRFGTAPWLTLSGMAVGFLTGFLSLLRQLKGPPSDQ
ncbi:MAG: AtpZ/AtpI family protein [Cyanobacteria bacterium NC_groundwater_1444_Ag_S-0.65um_54_12]|nr:AtpZ/AtpI family protein [Cyanobacteria bacterium NC_groundwater_1444_Ag_S-0.65um_54_12]